ncbi:MAG TPA: hypothetical protein VFN10_03070 [Thermoanaerobaculia bacterium]|nr:hypothetical protein [Thermoanaerobaculia bacterium]
MFLKQYGERRTGTNALRALIAANFEDVIVLMHILGDKHSPPVDLDGLWREVQDADDAPWQFISRATLDRPSLTTRSDNAWQSAEMRRHAAPLAQAFAAGAFGYVISIKNPYAWAVSIAKFTNWSRAVATERLREACRVFNDCYRAWLPLLERGPALLIRHEDLIRDTEGVLDRLGRTFGIRRSATFRPIEKLALPADWDDGPLPIGRSRFDAGRYLREEYLQALSPPQRDVVTSTMDWELLGRFGYAPLAD